MSALAATILAWMLTLQPARITPWASTYEATATAIASVVESEPPLFDKDATRVRTAALLVSLAWFESRFDVRAVGDHGSAHGLYQVHDRGELADPAEATRVALDMVRASFRACRGRDRDELLGWYAAGGPDCTRGLRESRNRLALARRLAAKAPVPLESRP